MSSEDSEVPELEGGIIEAEVVRAETVPAESGGSDVPPPAPPKATAPKGAESKDTSFRIGWLLFFGLALLGLLFLVFWSGPFGLGLLGLDLLYLGTCLHEVRSPNVAFLFRMGKMVGQLDAGWYLTIPHLWTIETISRERIMIDLPGQGMYTKSKRPITLNLKVFYHVVDLKKALLTRKTINERVRAVVLAQLKGEVGKNDFAKLLTDRSTLEANIKGGVNKELADDGYQVTGIEIEDLDENVESRAETIREIGRAKGDEAKALAEPLKGNYPAALVSVAGTLAETAERIFVPAKTKTAPPSPTPKEEEKKGLSEAAREIAERLRGR